MNDEKLRTLFKKGAINVILFLHQRGEARYSEIKKQGYVIGDRSLSRLLKELEKQKLLERRVISTYPVATIYTLTNEGRLLAKHLNEIKNLLTSQATT